MNNQNTPYVYQEFPKWKYHPTLKARIVQNAEEEKALGKGWYNRPNELPKPSPLPVLLERLVKPLWTRWGWIVVALGAVFGTVGTFVKLWR
jgi:hypothetical protein